MLNVKHFVLALFVCMNCYSCKAESVVADNEKQEEIVDYGKPNVILIFVDDLGFTDLSCQGSADIRTPNIDAFAASGVRFTNGYCTAPQCGPSRAGVMTGINQARFGYLDNKNNRGLPSTDKAPTVAEYMKRNGYVTGMIGKWHIGDEDDFPQSIIEKSMPENNGFDYVLKHNRGMSHYFPYRSDGELWMTSRNREPKLTEIIEGSKELSLKDYPSDAYLTDVFSEEAVNFINRHKESPFFLYLAYNAPHTPLVAKDEDMEVNSHIVDIQRRKFAGMMTALDRGVGQLTQELETLGLKEKTLIFFISDNGGPTGENTSKNDPFTGFKGDVLEGGIRVPYIVSWPSVIPANQVLDIAVTTLDVLPTSVELAGGALQSTASYSGVNIVPYLTHEKTGSVHDYIIWRWRSKKAIRKGDFKYVMPDGGQQ